MAAAAGYPENIAQHAYIKFQSDKIQSQPNPAPISNNPHVQTPLELVENKIRQHVFAKRIRLTEVFEDFDKLRSGLITATQFRRCAGSALDNGTLKRLSETEYKIVIDHYSNKDTKGVNWHAFVDNIDKVFGEKGLEKTPTRYNPTPKEVLKPIRPLPENSEQKLDDIISRIRSYVTHHGSDVKGWFTDFDKHKTGCITRSQFARGLPSNFLDDEEELLLCNQYCDDNSFNYYKLNGDVNSATRRGIRKGCSPHLEALDTLHKVGEYIPVGTEDLLLPASFAPQHVENCELIERKIKKVVYKERIRVIDFFRDYDRHNNGVITESQFKTGLHNLKAELEKYEIDILLRVYSDKQGSVQYRKFCTSIDSIFTVQNLEGNPLVEVCAPKLELLSINAHPLSADEETQCSKILSRFKTIVAQKRPMMAPYFKDFDRIHLGNMGRVTRSHFSRLLSTLKFELTDNELHILFKKYAENNRVNYMEFIRAIDPLTYSSLSKPNEAKSEDRYDTTLPAKSFNEIISLIKYQVASKRIRVSEFFRDMDKLRSYSIAKQEFIRGINRIGVLLDEKESELVAAHYANPSKLGYCLWKNFESDIESVFGESHLEVTPSKVPKPIVENTPFIITTKNFSAEQEQLLVSTLNKIKGHLKVRQCSIKPFFRDFDKLCTGFVTKSQFRQCLTYAQCTVDDAEFEILAAKWGNNLSGPRVCYMLFLDEIDIDREENNTPATKYNAVYAAGQDKRGVQILSPDESAVFIRRLKTKVMTERIRVNDYMQDFDHLRHGKISKNEFRRALNVIFFNLTEVELASLETIYEANNNMVDYVKFCNEIESVFTEKGLENEPTKILHSYEKYVSNSGFKLSQTEETLLSNALKRITGLIIEERIDILAYMEDYDFVNEGTITTNQFRAVLSSVSIPVDDDEIMMISKKFSTSNKLDRINYRSFWRVIEQIK